MELCSEAEHFRKQGARLHREKQFKQAIECFSRANAIQPNHPTPLSNRASSSFELGNYTHAAIDLQNAIDLILLHSRDATINPHHNLQPQHPEVLPSQQPPNTSNVITYSQPAIVNKCTSSSTSTQISVVSSHSFDPKISSLLSLLYFRLAKCFFYSDDYNRACPFVNTAAELHNASMINNLSQAAKALATIQKHTNISFSYSLFCSHFPLVRPPRITNVSKFVPVKHACLTSWILSPESQRLSQNSDKSSVLTTENFASSKSVLICASGSDPSNFFATFYHIDKTFKQWSATSADSPSHTPYILVNDKKPQAIARLLLFAYYSWELYEIESNDHSSRIFLQTFIYQLYLGVFILPDVQQKLISDLEHFCSLKQFSHTCIEIDDNTWRLCRSVFQTWLEAAKSQNVKVVDSWYSEHDAQHLTAVMATQQNNMVFQRTLQSFKDSEAHQFDTFLSLLSDQELHALYRTHSITKDANTRQGWLNALKELFEAKMESSRFESRDAALQRVRLLYSEEYNCWSLHKFLLPPEEIRMRCNQSIFKSPACDNWAANVTLFAQDWISYNLSQGKYRIVLNPFLQMSYIHDFIQDAENTREPIVENKATTGKSESMFMVFADFLHGACQGLGNLVTSDNLRLEFHIGDLLSISSHVMSDQRLSKDAPRHFTDIIANDSAELVGFLNCFTCLKPLLLDPNGILNLNSSSRSLSYKNFVEYFYSHTMLQSLEFSSSVFGLELKDGSLWEGSTWKVCELGFHADLVSRDFVETYLYKVFLHVAYPIKQSSKDPNCENFPQTINVFFNLLKQFVQNGYPKHWISYVVDSILENKVETLANFSTATAPSLSSSMESQKMHVDVSSIQTEFRALLSLWIPFLQFGVLSSIGSLEDVAEYWMTFVCTDMGGRISGDSFSPVVSFAIVELADPAMEESFASTPSNIWSIKKLVDEKSVHFTGLHLFSSVRWDSETNSIFFRIRKKDIDRLMGKTSCGCVFRSDTWDMIVQPQALYYAQKAPTQMISDGINL